MILSKKKEDTNRWQFSDKFEYVYCLITISVNNIDTIPERPRPTASMYEKNKEKEQKDSTPSFEDC